MRTHNLLQGSPQWLQYRQGHFNASDAAAMLGVSPYKTRSQLMHELHTGIVPDVDPHTQARFDAGHAAEEAARALAESEIGEDLYPVVGSLVVDGLPLSASFDGLTMDGNIVWEHKLMNVDLAESLSMGIIPDQYAPQLEQQLLVSGADKALFMATSGCKTAMECVWYTSIPGIRSQIIAGWKQFADDLASYEPPVSEPAPVGRTPDTLPALHIEVTGMVTASNLAEFKAHALAVFCGINRDLVTDAQFADAEKTVKWCSDIEQRLAAAKQHALSQTASIDALFRTISDISDEARAVRLELDKLVKARKDAIRAEIVADGRNALNDYINALSVRIGHQIPLIPVDFAGSIKSKRTLDSMRDAVSTELARAKIEANAVADKITINLRTLNERPELAFLFSDTATLALKEPEFVAMAVKSRIAEHQAKEAARIEAERTRIATEERAKAEAAIESAQAIVKAESETYAELERSEIKRLSDLNNAMVVEVKAPQPGPMSPPTLKLGQIADRLGFQLTARFLDSLGFKPSDTDGRALLFHENDFPRLCAVLVRHIQTVAQGVAA